MDGSSLNDRQLLVDCRRARASDHPQNTGAVFADGWQN